MTGAIAITSEQRGMGRTLAAHLSGGPHRRGPEPLRTDQDGRVGDTAPGAGAPSPAGEGA